MLRAAVVVVLGLCAVTALPQDPILRKLESGLRYQYIRDADGLPHLADLWGSATDLAETTRYNPATENIYHLFTRANPTVSQPLLLNRNDLLSRSNFNPNRRTIVLVHGWRTDIYGNFATVLIPAYLASEDVNVIALDWTAGASTIRYPAAMANTYASAASVADFINWVNRQTGATLSSYKLIGHSLGGQQVGNIGRHLGGQVPYLIALDPAFFGWSSNPNRFSPNDGIYTEVIHSNVGLMGALAPLGDVDFYPNGGLDMPGCTRPMCDHDRPIYYLAESLITGGFIGRECSSYLTALGDECTLPGRLPMGGKEPKTGATGVYRFDTNAFSPFSLD